MDSALFPTPVGMNRQSNIVREFDATIPHACGDEPVDSHLHNRGSAYSPRLWG